MKIVYRMDRVSSEAQSAIDRASQAAFPYPLQRQSFVLGLWAGAIGWCLFGSLLAGFSLAVLVWAAGALWRRDEPPILAFCVAYQWFFVVTGFYFRLVTDRYPGLPVTGDLETAVLLSLVGFLALAGGIRAGLYLVRHRFFFVQQSLHVRPVDYDVRRLFWTVACLYTVNWIVEVDPMEIRFDAAQVIYRVLEFRTIFLFLLFVVILQKRKGYQYGAAAMLYVLAPRFASVMSNFKELFFLACVALLGEWRPWSESDLDKARSARIPLIAVGSGVALLVMGLVWEGGVKPVWRPAMRVGAVQGSVVDKVAAFAGTLHEAVPALEMGAAFEALASRMSSGIGYFSHVVERVPEHLPYENGRLTLRALQLTLTPRFLFPDKPNLGADSWLIREYAGLYVAGEENETSVGLGYMAEFYIDYGVPGILVLTFLYGCAVGLVYATILLFSPSHSFFCGAVTAILLQHFASYEGEIAKLLGGLLQACIIFSILSYVTGRLWHGQLLLSRVGRDSRAPGISAGAETLGARSVTS